MRYRYEDVKDGAALRCKMEARHSWTGERLGHLAGRRSMGKIRAVLALLLLVCGCLSRSFAQSYNTPGIYTSTITTSGNYTFSLRGADGGNGEADNYFSLKGGEGAHMSATFYLDAGDVITIIVGGHGNTGSNVDPAPFLAGGGGGGTGVILNGTTVLIAAAGGGGASGVSDYFSYGYGGGASINSAPAGGHLDSSYQNNGGAGGGFDSAGASPVIIDYSCTLSTGGGAGSLTAISPGGLGGYYDYDNQSCVSNVAMGGAGFGGGGGAYNSIAGGGGGYKGGNGGNGANYTGYGGDSYVNPNGGNILAEAGADGGGNFADGSAVITSSPAGFISGPNYLCVGGTISLTNTGSPGGVWSSSFPSKATVTQSGVVTGIAQGVDTIKYTVNGAVAKRVITVYNNPVINAGSDVNICNGTSTSLTATGGTSYIWSPSAGLSCSNCASPVAQPTVTTVYVVKGTKTSCSTRDTVVVTVTNTPSAGTITGPSAALTGSSITLADAVTGGTWSSTNTSVATINNTGMVAGIASGIDTIKYTVSNNCGTAMAKKVVSFGNPGSITGPAYICTGAATSFTTSGDAGGTWSSSFTTKATVNQSGSATGISQGIDTIIYTANGVAAKKVVTVYTSPVITAGADATICYGTSVTLGATGGTTYVWSPAAGLSCTTCSSPVATPLATTAYVVTGTKTGCSTKDTVMITITPQSDAGIITGPSTLAPGASVTLVDNTASSAGIWGSKNTAVATVNASGHVTGITAGIDTITYTINGGSCGTSVATKVLTFANAGTITGLNYLCVGSSVTLANSTATQGGTWSSSFPFKATVSAGGVVTGIAQGVDTIYYSYGSAVAKKVVTVYNNPVINAGSDAAICSGDTDSLTATGGTSYSWSPANGLSCTTCANPAASPTVTTAYVVTGTKTGCSSKDTVVVTINPPGSDGYITGPHHVLVGHTITLIDSAGTPGGIWHADNNYVTIDQNGVVTGVGVGQTFVTYHAFSGCFSPVIQPLFMLTSDYGSFRTTQETGVANVGSETEPVINAYPNPVKNELYIDFGANSQDVSIILTDITGRQVAVIASIKAATGTQHIAYNVAALAKGMYYLQAGIGAQVKTQKIVIE